MCTFCHAKYDGRGKGISKNVGEKHPNARLKDTDIREIRLSLKEGISGTFLAKKYKVSNVRISLIKNRKSWKHIH